MPKKTKILLAVGERNLENFLKERLSDEYTFVKEASYREIVIKRIDEERPNIVLLREALKGSMSIERLVLDIRESYPDVRIVFYTSKYRPGEPLLRKLVSYGVYDFIAGESVTESQIFDAIRNEKQLSDVRKYLDAPTLESAEPVMNITTEYKDLSKTPEPEPEIIEEPEEEPEEKPKKGLFSRLFGGKKKKKDKSKKKKRKKKEENEPKITVDENPEEETSFWDEVDEYVEEDESSVKNSTKEQEAPREQLVLPKEPVKEEEGIELGKVQNPLPMFNQPDKPKKDKTGTKESTPVKESSTVVVEEEDSEEEDLFENYQQQTEPEEIQEPELIEEDELDDEAEQDDRLTLPARGKPSSDEIALHQKELTETGEREQIKRVDDYVEPQPEIDFNPMEVDAPKPAKTEAPKPPKQSSSESKPKKVKQHEPIEHNEERSVGWFGRRNAGKIEIKSKQVVTFVSAVHGSGNTHVAFNSALKLADEGNKVLYLDMNPTFSSIDFSFQLGTWQQGIDKALEDIEYNQGMTVSDNILKIENLKAKRKEKQFVELYKSLPDTLDYMFYSQDYQTLEKQHPVPKERLKDLVMYLMTREDYDVLVIDSEPLGEVGVDGLLNISNKIYITMTQDPGQMGVFHRQFDAAKKRVNITDNRYIVVNQFVKTEPTVKRVQKWTNETVLQTVPFTHKGVIQANYLGEPFILKTRHQPAINAFESLAEHIAE